MSPEYEARKELLEAIVNWQMEESVRETAPSSLEEAFPRLEHVVLAEGMLGKHRVRFEMDLLHPANLQYVDDVLLEKWMYNTVVDERERSLEEIMGEMRQSLSTITVGTALAVRNEKALQEKLGLMYSPDSSSPVLIPIPDGRFSSLQQQEINLAYLADYPPETYEIFQPYQSVEQMEWLRLAIEHFPLELAKLCAAYPFQKDQMIALFEAMENGFTLEQLAVIADPKFTAEQLKSLNWNHLPLEQLQFLANPDFTSLEMSAIAAALDEGVDFDLVQGISNLCHRELVVQVLNILRNEQRAKNQEGFTEQQLKEIWIAKNRSHLSRECLVYLQNPKLSPELMATLRKAFEQDFPIELAQNLHLNEGFCLEQVEEVLTGFMAGLEVEKLQLYTIPSLSSEQMETLRQAFQDGLSLEQVETFSDPSMSAESMREAARLIRRGGETKPLSAQERKLVNYDGNLTQDPRITEIMTKDGKQLSVVAFTICYNPPEKKEERFFINCSAFGAKGNLVKGFKKGDFVHVFGPESHSQGRNGYDFTNLSVWASRLLRQKNREVELDPQTSSETEREEEKPPEVMEMSMDYER